MSKFKRFMILSLAAVGFIPAFGAQAGVSLVLAANAAPHTGTSTTVNSSSASTFQVTVEMISTTSNANDTVSGLSYQLQSSTSGIFTLVNRDYTAGGTNTSSNPFSDYNQPNSLVLGASAATLNPSNGTPGSFPFDGDLGATLNNSTVSISNNYPNGTGTFNPAIVATYTISVPQGTPHGAYTLSVIPLNANGFGYNSSTNNYTDETFSNPPAGSPLLQTFTVNVVPEPSSALLIGLGSGALGLLRRRRR